MPLLLALIIGMISFAPASYAAKTLDKNKFVAPGSEKTDLRAPQNDISSKAPGVANPAVGATNTGERGPISPINEICPVNYHCSVSSSGSTRCLPNSQNMSIEGPESCFNVARLCKIYREDIAKGETLDESDAAKFAYYCN